MMADSQPWKCVEAVPAILFSIEGSTAVRARDPRRGGWLTVAEATVDEVGDHRLGLEDGVTLSYALPAAVCLAPLFGARVKLALRDEPSPTGPRAQTLVVTGEGRTRLVARFGPSGQTHAIGRGLRVRTALSQRPNGPMAFGTEKLQYVVHPGEHVRVRGDAGDFVLCFVARTAYDHVAYVIVERGLWA